MQENVDFINNTYIYKKENVQSPTKKTERNIEELFTKVDFNKNFGGNRFYITNDEKKKYKLWGLYKDENNLQSNCIQFQNHEVRIVVSEFDGPRELKNKYSSGTIPEDEIILQYGKVLNIINKLKKYDYVYIAHPTPSGLGLRIIFVTDKSIINEKEYSETCKYYTEQIKTLYDKDNDFELDPSVYSGARYWYLPISKENIYYNNNFKQVEVIKPTIDNKIEIDLNIDVNPDLLKEILQILSGNLEDYYDFIKTCITLRNLGYTDYDEFDWVFKGVSNYNYEENKKHFESIKPKNKTGFGTLVRMANKFDEELVEKTLQKYNGKIKTFVVNNIDEAVIEFAKEYTIININNERIYSPEIKKSYKNTYMLNLTKHTLLPLYSETSYSPNNNTKNYIEDSFLGRCLLKRVIVTKNGTKEKLVSINITDFWKKLNKSLIDKKLDVKEVVVSNLGLIIGDEYIYTTNPDKGIIISNDYENLIYRENLMLDITQKEIDEVMYELNALYGKENALILLTHMCSAKLNENSGEKHILLIISSSSTGKSKTTEMIYKGVNFDSDCTTIGTEDLDKLWPSFFKTRTPTIDNLDIYGEYEKKTLNYLCRICTSSTTELNIRYSKSGKKFLCDVYPQITSIVTELFSEMKQNIQSRCIPLNLPANEYAELNLIRLKDDPTFIQKLRKVVLYYIYEYLKVRKELTWVNKEIKNRCKNFFRFLAFLNPSFAKEFDKQLRSDTQLKPISNCFIKMLNKKPELVSESESDLVYKTTTELYKDFNIFWRQLDAAGKIPEYLKSDFLKISPQTLFRNYLDGDIISGMLGEYKVITKMSKHSTKRAFVLIKPTDEETKIPDKTLIPIENICKGDCSSCNLEICVEDGKPVRSNIEDVNPEKSSINTDGEIEEPTVSTPVENNIEISVPISVADEPTTTPDLDENAICIGKYDKDNGICKICFIRQVKKVQDILGNNYPKKDISIIEKSFQGCNIVNGKYINFYYKDLSVFDPACHGKEHDCNNKICRACPVEIDCYNEDIEQEQIVV